MLNSLKRNPIIFAICFFSIFVIARVIILGDPSKFIVAGSDFFEPEQWQEKIHVKEGQGYDGQFFFNYAHNPFTTQIQPHSKVDLPPYRHQRIGYPTLSWLLSFGNPNWLPYSLIIVNLLAAIGLSFFVLQFTNQNENWLARLAPILAPGILMSVSRDLSEVLATFFVVGAIYFILNKKALLFTLFTIFALLTRETEIVILGPVILWIVINKEIKLSARLLSILPIVAIGTWKLVVIQNWYPNYESPMQNLSFPLWGFVHSFWLNLQVSSIKEIIELVFWIAYAVLIIAIFTKSIKQILSQKNVLNTPFPIVIIATILFSFIFSEAIYIDDWAFVRVLTSAIVVALLYLAKENQISKSWIFSLLIISGLTFLRLIVRI